MKKFSIKLVGTRPLLMHSARSVDPLDPLMQQKATYTALRKKTEADQLEIYRLDFMLGLYHDSDLGPYLPSDNVFKALIEAARKSKQGKLIEQGLYLTTDVCPLVYVGPRDPEGLFADANFVDRRSVKQQMSRIIRTRPIFREWQVTMQGMLDENVLNWKDLNSIVAIAGEYIGVGDWRPRYGTFTAEVKAL